MRESSFEVKPVASYDGARYPAAPGADDEIGEERTHPAVLVVAVLLLLGISVGLIGCYMRTDYVPETPGVDGGPDGDPPDGDPPTPECDEGAVQCIDSTTAQTCEQGAWVTEDCLNTCAEGEAEDVRYAPVGYCDASLEDPCVCDYGIEEGVAPECTPGDVSCVDEATISYCEEGMYEPMIQNCDDYCVEHYGVGYISYGCDATAEDPCQCDYDMIDGDVATCTPGDVQCWSETTLARCNESMFYDTVECADYCVSTYGPDYVTLGCDIALEDPCNCAAPGSGSEK